MTEFDVPTYRDKIPADAPLVLGAMVARPVGRKERDSTPEALAAVAKEWRRLRTTKHKYGVGVWDESRVRERRDVAREANAKGEIVHAHCASICDFPKFCPKIPKQG